MRDAEHQLCDPNTGLGGLLYSNPGPTSVSVRAVSLHMMMMPSSVYGVLRGHNSHPFEESVHC
jgi:hypothetical protein